MDNNEEKLMDEAEYGEQVRIRREKLKISSPRVKILLPVLNSSALPILLRLRRTLPRSRVSASLLRAGFFPAE